jgi:aminomethyltransferase
LGEHGIRLWTEPIARIGDRNERCFRIEPRLTAANTIEADELMRTTLFERHVAAGGRMVDFAGWEMPLQYPGGIVAEHLATRRRAGLFDVSHMGRFTVRGAGALPFLQHVLTNNAAALEVCQAQYTIIADERGGAIDDAYLYRFSHDEYLLVVNAANRLKDWDHFAGEAAGFDDLDLRDVTREIAMIALQGPASRDILAGAVEAGRLPEPLRNELAVLRAAGTDVRVGRTGYTGEPLCFELFTEAATAPRLWDALVAGGAAPAGLGARDTLRLEAGLPLYGYELGTDDGGVEIPLFAIPLAKLAVSFSPLKGDFVGRAALARQHDAFALVVARDYSRRDDLPRLVQPLAAPGRAACGSRLRTRRTRGDNDPRRAPCGNRGCVDIARGPRACTSAAERGFGRRAAYGLGRSARFDQCKHDCGRLSRRFLERCHESRGAPACNRGYL